MFGRLSLAGLVVAPLLACSGVAYGPTLRAANLGTGDCATWSVDLDASARGEVLLVTVDQEEVLRELITEPRVVHLEGVAVPGVHKLHAELAGQVIDTTLVVEDFPLELELGPSPELVAGLEAQLPLTLVSSCEVLPPVTVLNDRQEQVLSTEEGGARHTAITTMVGTTGTHHLRYTIQSGSMSLYPSVDVEVRAPNASELRLMDADGDGDRAERYGGGDCDDADPTVNSDAREQPAPNGRDDNCNGVIDEGTTAYDDDGDGLSEEQGDCNDADPGRHPGATELPDCRDQDCDGLIDEGAPLTGEDIDFEPNDDRSQAYDLQTRGEKSFSRTLRLQTSSDADQEWFTFYSSDDDWDLWHINAVIEQMADNGSYEISLYQGSQHKRTLTAREGEGIHRLGSFFQDGTGQWTVGLRPRGVPARCPLLLRLSSG